MKNTRAPYKACLYFILSILFSELLFLTPSVSAGLISELNLLYPLSNHGSFYAESSLFVFAGSSSYVTNKVLSTILENGHLLKWEEISTNVPKQLFWHSMSFDYPYVFLIGGNEYISSQSYSSNSVYSAEIQNGKISKWLTQTSLPIPSAYGASIIVSDVIYYSGGANWQGSMIGTDNSIISATLSNGTISSWSDAGNLPAPMLGHAIINTGKKIYLISGYDANEGRATGNIYEGTIKNGKFIWSAPLTNTFPDPDYRAYSFMTTVVGDTVIVAGGRGPILHDQNTYDQIFFSKIQDDGSLGTWQKSAYSLPKPTCCAGMANDGSNVFITGGHNGTTGEYYSSVWYSPVLDLATTTIPTPTVPPPTPTVTPELRPLIVFVPGMGASWNSSAILHGEEKDNTEWSIPEFIDLYDGFIKNLESVGYRRDENLWVYAYDWRDNVMQNGDALRSFILNNVLSGKPAGTKVALVGHSMGGLVSRAAVNQSLAPRVDKIITLGTPHGGSAKAYPVWEGADFSDFDGFQSILLRSYLRANSLFYDSQTLAVRDLIPSIRNLLPTHDFLIDKKGEKISWNNMVWKNNLTQNLNPLMQYQTGKIYTLAGKGKSTISEYVIGKEKGSKYEPGQWPDGKPMSKNNSTLGDDTVLISDAAVTGEVGGYTFDDTSHGEIVTKIPPQYKLMDILGLGDLDRIGESRYKKFNKGLVVMLGSPAEFEMIIPGNGKIFPQDNLILYDDPPTGGYRINLTTTGQGKYTLYFGRLNGGDEAWEEFHGYSAASGEEISLQYYVDMSRFDLGANPKENMQEKISNLIQKLNQNTEFGKVKKPLEPHLRNLLRLLTQIDSHKQNWVKLILIKNINTYLVNVTESTKQLVSRYTNPDQYMEIIMDLRSIRMDLSQYSGDLNSFPN